MNTQDLMKFGYRELDMAGDLLKALKDGNDTKFLGDNVAVEFNPNSGNVFLVDGDYNVAMMADGVLCDWHVLSYEGHEGFIEDLREMYQQGEITQEEDVEQLTSIAEAYDLDINSEL